MKEIKGFENYSIDEQGNVFNNKNKEIKPSLNNKGYLRLSLRKNKIRYYFSVHRLVALNYLTNPNNYPQVNHIDGNKTNNHYSNLEWCTNKQNIKHSFDNGLSDYKGERNGRVILSDIIILEIRKDFNNGVSRKDLSSKYNISYSHIVSIIANKRR